MKRKNIIALLAICILIILAVYRYEKNLIITEFSAENWRSVDSDQRYHMLEDLYAKVELIGMSSEEIEKLLGEYEFSHEAYWSDEGKCDYHWGYTVRYDSWEGDEYLLISFKDDIVVGYELEYGSEL